MGLFSRFITLISGLSDPNVKSYELKSVEIMPSEMHKLREASHYSNALERPASNYAGLGGVEADLFGRNLDSASFSSVELRKRATESLNSLQRFH